MDTQAYKQHAAELAVDEVQSGMVVGLGHGTTARYAVRKIAALLQEGRLRDILGVPCSLQVEEEARQLGIPLTTLEEHPAIDLTIDGADEVEPQTLNLIKGGGGALLREKVVAQASKRVIIVIDYSKLSPALGTHVGIPIEAIPFGWGAQQRYLEALRAEVALRTRDDGTPFLTDQGNLILDCRFGPLAHPEKLAAKLQARAGLVEHGLFLGLTSEVIVSGATGVRHLKRS